MKNLIWFKNHSLGWILLGFFKESSQLFRSLRISLTMGFCLIQQFLHDKIN